MSHCRWAGAGRNRGCFPGGVAGVKNRSSAWKCCCPVAPKFHCVSWYMLFDGTRPSLNYFLMGFTACSSVLHLVVVTSQQRFVGCMYFVIHPRHISIAACMGMACWPLFPAPLPEAVWMCIHSSRGGAVTLAVCSYACNNATVGLAHSCFCAQSPADTVYRG